MNGQISSRPSIHNLSEVAAFLGSGLYLILMAKKLWEVGLGSNETWLLAGCLLAGYLLSDLMSGAVHWLADRFGSTSMPFLGPNFIRPFRDHHVDPDDITRHGFVETNGNSCLIIVVPLMLVYHLVPLDGANWRLVLNATIWSLCLSIIATNQFHKWAHCEHPPASVRWLQRYRIILSPEHHLIHHQAPYDTHYRITTGWLNPLLAKLRAFEYIEYGVWRMTGISTVESDFRPK